jgi:hypothetical protein
MDAEAIEVPLAADPSLPTFEEVCRSRRLVPDGFSIFQWPEFQAFYDRLEKEFPDKMISASEAEGFEYHHTPDRVTVSFPEEYRKHRRTGRWEVKYLNTEPRVLLEGSMIGCSVFRWPEFQALRRRLGIPEVHEIGLRMRFVEGELPAITLDFAPMEPNLVFHKTD